MQDFFGFFASVIIISASGVMSPGPLFAATASSAMRLGRLAGLQIAAGHTVVELPLVVMIGLGVLSLESLPEFRVIASVLGALSIFAFVGFQLRSVFKSTITKDFKRGAFLTGIFLTGLNPFFLIWWFTIGIKLISDALLLWSFWGVLIMFFMHIWMDYAWLFFVSVLSSKGAKFLSNNRYKIVMVAINAALIYFGILFIISIV
jgi:threonine/homoserine/homoserine lactone efflux protein